MQLADVVADAGDVVGIRLTPAHLLPDIGEDGLHVCPERVKAVLAKVLFGGHSERATGQLRRALQHVLEHELRMMAIQKDDRVDEVILVQVVGDDVLDEQPSPAAVALL